MNPAPGLLVLLCAASLSAAEPVSTDLPPAASTGAAVGVLAELPGPTGTPDPASRGSTLVSTDTLRPAPFEAAPEPARRVSTGTFHLAAFRRLDATLALSLLEPLERLLKEGEFVLSEVEGVVGHFRGDEYLYQTADPRDGNPMEEPGAPAVREVSVLSVVGGYMVLPDDQECAAGLEAAARDVASYREGRVPRLAVRRAQLTATPMLDGSVIHSIRFLDGRSGAAVGWQNALVRVYRLQRGLQEVEVVFLYKTLGGPGRIAGLLDDLHRRYGKDLLALSRGELFTYGPGGSTGTVAGMEAERLGVDAAVPGAGELGRLRDVLSYTGARGDQGVVFLCANLVFSTAPAKTLLPPFRLWEVGGRTVAVVGLTDPETARYIEPGMAQVLSIKDPFAAAAELVPGLRRSADIVVALTNLPVTDNAALKRRVKGLDLIVGDSFPFETETALPTVTVSDPERGPADEALLIASDGNAVVTHLEVEGRRIAADRNSLTVKEEHVFLDESVMEVPDLSALRLESYGVSSDTHPAVLPSARRLYAGSKASVGTVRLKRRDFWTLAAALAREESDAEAAFVPVFDVYDEHALGDYREDTVRQWFQLDDELRVFELAGNDLRELVGEVRRQERGGEVPRGGLTLAAAGFGEGDYIHGVDILPNAVYRVAATDRLLARTAQFPALSRAQRVRWVGPLRDVVMTRLRRASDAGLSVEQYRNLLKGRTLSEEAYWSVNFRDVSLKASNTKVVSDPAFDNVSNARMRSFDEQRVGGAVKVDAERYRGRLKWTNTLELEYSRSRLSPPGQPSILNIPLNRSSFLSLGTLRAGEFPWKWMAQSYGPSFGAQYEGDIERLPGARRKHVLSLYPGVELYNGSWIQSLGVAANLRRDYTPPAPLNQYGVRVRVVASRPAKVGVIQGEFLTNYFIRTRRDTNQDLRLEMNGVTRLQMPLWKHMTIIPFLDFYYFILKTRPVAGYSAIMGMSLGFSRLWKPQFESF